MSDERDPIPPEQLKELAKRFIDAMHGNPGEITGWIAGERPCALAHLVATEGRLRLDWIALVRDVLDMALETYRQGPHRYNKSTQPQDVADSIRTDWGLDAYPSKLRTPDRERKTRALWKEKLYASESVRLAVGTRITALVGPPDDTDVGHVDARSFHWSLNPPGYWVDDQLDRWLIERARSVLGGMLEDADDQPQLLRSLLCVALADRLSEYFEGTQQDAINYFRHLHQTVIPAWSRTIVLHGPVPDITGAEKPTRGSSFASVATAAVALLAPLITSSNDHRRSLVLEYERFRAARATESVWPSLGSGLSAHAGPFSVTFVDFSGVERLVRSEGLRFLLTKAGAAPTALATLDPRDGDEFLESAWEIRNCADPILKRHFISRYVAARERLEKMPTRQDSVALNHADHLVSWDTVTSEEPELALRLALAMERQRTVGVSGYRTHRYRALAILANKHNKVAVADHLLNLGSAELASSPDLGEIEIESAQQLCLAKAGVWSRQLEAYLREVPQEVRDLPQAEHAAHEALAFAGMAYELLLELAPGLPLDPIAGRQQDNRIGTVSWNVQTRIIRLRAGLASCTAIQAGLCRVESVIEGLSQSARGLAVDDAEMSLAWRELIGREELSSSHQLDLCRIGLWLAFLRGLRLPLTMHAAKAYATRLAFFDGDPAEIEQGWVEKSIDPGDASIWLEVHAADAGWLSWAEDGSAGNHSLSCASGGAYRDWLGRERLRCKVSNIERSHD